MFCSKCGNQLPDDAVFCSKCGAKIGESAAQESQSAAFEKSHEGKKEKKPSAFGSFAKILGNKAKDAAKGTAKDLGKAFMSDLLGG